MKYIQSIFVIFFLVFGFVRCSVQDQPESSDPEFAGTIRLLPIAPDAYDRATRVSTDGAQWGQGDVVFVRIAFYADPEMDNQSSVEYVALRRGDDNNWIVATSGTQDDADFTVETIDSGADDVLWNTTGVVSWPLVGVSRAKVQALYAGLHPRVELLSEGAVRVSVNASNIGLSEMLIAEATLSLDDLSDPVELAFAHRLTRLDFGKGLENEIQIVSGSSGSGVDMIPEKIDFDGVISARNKIVIPSASRYVYITAQNMITTDANRIFRLQDAVSGGVKAAFSLPPIPSDQVDLGGGYYYGLSYNLVDQIGGEVTPDNMFAISVL